MAENSVKLMSLNSVILRRFCEMLSPRNLFQMFRTNKAMVEYVGNLHRLLDIDFVHMEIATKRVLCLCGKEECLWFDETILNEKIPVEETIEITNKNNANDSTFFNALPITFDSNRTLILTVDFIDFNVLNDLIHNQMKNLDFQGAVNFSCTSEEAIEFFEFLFSSMDKVVFLLRRAASLFYFDVQLLLDYGESDRFKDGKNSFGIYRNDMCFSN